MSWWPRLTLLAILVVGTVLSPLRAAAAIPMLIAYDAAVRPTSTMALGQSDAVGREAERAPTNDYEATAFGYDDPSNLRVAAGVGQVRAYDRHLEHVHRRELRDEGAIYSAPSATTAAEAFSGTELGIVNEVRGIPLGQLEEAFRAGGAELNVGGRTILVDPGVPSSGFTLTEENGFVLGREAFASRAELVKTLLHETYRLSTGQAASGAGQGQVTAWTEGAAGFAERAFNAFFGE